jgi:bifunctional UDP-N-acetylglucosamine pyrophosphorylase/glucosamine-1-phosphate N-acetyltransferase
MAATAIILAAGRSTRMKSARPKVLHEVCGRPMLRYVLDACYEAGCGRAIVVVGHGKELVQAEFVRDDRIDWVEQTEQLGTGHAVRVCEAELRKYQQGSPHGDVFVLAGDGPLVRADNLRALRLAHQDERAAASLATASWTDPTGYGRSSGRPAATSRRLWSSSTRRRSSGRFARSTSVCTAPGWTSCWRRSAG